MLTARGEFHTAALLADRAVNHLRAPSAALQLCKVPRVRLDEQAAPSEASFEHQGVCEADAVEGTQFDEDARSGAGRPQQ